MVEEGTLRMNVGKRQVSVLYVEVIAIRRKIVLNMTIVIHHSHPSAQRVVENTSDQTSN